MLTRILFLGLLTQLLVACVTTKPQSQSPQSIVGQEVVIYRSTSFIGGGAKLFITLNGESITLYPWTEHKVILPPGTHVITKDKGTDLMGMPANLGLLRESLTFSVNADETIKIGASFNNPFVFDRLNSSGALINRSPMFAATGSVRSASASETDPVNQPQSNLPVCEGRDISRWTNCVGTTTYPNGDRYVGEFVGGKRNGQGSYSYVNGNKYFGEYRDGQIHGQGNFIWANGNRYIGEFKDNRRNGQGVQTFPDGSPIQEGIWEDNKLVFGQRIPDHIAGRISAPLPAQGVRGAGTAAVTVSEQSNLPACKGSDFSRWTNCFGTATYSGGSRYVGEWRNGKYHGQGIDTYADGRAPKAGIWEDDKFVRAEHSSDQIAGRASTAPVAQASRPVEAPRSATPLSLSASASQPSPDGVVTLSITTNNATASLKINGDEEGGRTDGRYSVSKFAQVGENRFEVVAVDRSGNTQRQTITVSRAIGEVVARIQPLNPIGISESKPRDAVAIIIGIEKYRRVPTADFANKDASVFYDYARRALGVKQENIKLLLDDKADAAEILVAFKNWLPTRVSKGKTDVYVFYSGHGLPSEDGNSLYFLPHEANRDLLDRTAIAQKELVDAIQRSSPKTVTMFIDSCYSGQSRTGETLLASARPIAVTAKQTSSFPSNFTVISASAPDQISSSSPELKHGIFSYYLMRGMEGEADTNKDKQITVAEMQAYLSENVSRRAMGMNRTQQPQVIGDQSRVLVGQ